MSLLLEPLTLRGTTLPNRMVLSPMCQYSVTAQDGVPTDWHLVHLGARAAGGFGTVLAEATAVRADGRISPQDTGLWNEEQVAGWRRITDFVRQQGAVPGVQLAHAGRKASTYPPFAGTAGSVPTADGGWGTVGPGREPFGDLATPAALDRAGIAAIVEAFADSAVRAVRAGFGVIELHGAHGYLLHQFLSPLSNTRTDAYGGNLAGRSRLLAEVVDAVRARIPDEMPLLVRLSGTDWVDGGWTIEDTVALARRIGPLGVDLFDVSSGGNSPTAQIPVGPGYQVPLAERVRHGAQVATGAVGLITTAAGAEQVLAHGSADLVLIGRAALRDPAWPQRAAADLGHPERVHYPDQYLRGAWR
ncbi:NADH:flavin oxidoreductase/NADH oxidase [Nakamurella sp. YIM 132087]|uniref:NADH:flavin oxidoreductase/NADH oxidase n=1 Tax=Nakamurella alba TaxID=2665158 RepID=A0A7K1FJD7_9ACTN|nr:NADH:flavin oxidoreductase/NADH oxidase [Nakamurella alba]MTD12994.1 NADH:flavin oxidoreductase/NADH oxidase [Nakamurella alba]